MKFVIAKTMANDRLEVLKKLAQLIRQRNATEVQITRVIGRPAQLGHLGEYIAAIVFKITLGSSASGRGHDGLFQEGPLKGQTVNIKWYAKREGFLDLEPRSVPDHYLVLTGPFESPGSSKGMSRPWVIRSTFLFDAPRLVDELTKAGRRIGIATSVRKQLWEAAELWPNQRNATLSITDEQRSMLTLFS